METTMTTTAEKTVLVHKWQDAGLGVAPFKVWTIISIPSKSLCEHNPEAYNRGMGEACHRAKALGVSLCSCQFCGMSLENNVVIRDASGKHFVVGLDCAMKTGDSKVMTEAQDLERQRKIAIRHAKREEMLAKREAERAAELESQRQKNGGMTDYEVAAVKRQRELQDTIDANRIKYGWLLDELDKARNGLGFVTDMIDRIERYGMNERMSEKVLNVLADIYAKQSTDGARKNSAKFIKAWDSFFERTRGK